MADRGQVLQELDRRGALPEKYRAEYETMKTSGGIAPKGGFKPMQPAAADKLEEQVTAYSGLDRAVTSFKDDYAGAGSGIENFAQGLIGTGTTGQRDWWADFKTSDNAVRNALFGASLTPGESASYAATTVSPNMDAEQVRQNLARRRDLAKTVLGRRAAFARANGYTPEAVTAILGEYDPAKQPTAAQPGAAESGQAGGTLAFSDEMPSEPLAQLKPEDRAAYFQLERTAKTPGELVGFMADRGFNMDVKNAREILDAREKGSALGDRGVVYKPDKTIDQGDGITGSVLRGVGDTATFGMLDEIGGVVDTLGGTAGRESVWNSGRSLGEILANNVAANRAIMAGDEQNHPVARFAGQMAGGALVPFGAGARTAGQIAKVGAASGAAYGFGSSEGNVVERAPSALGGAAVGALGGYAIGKAAPAIGGVLGRAARPPSPVRQEAADLMAAAGRQDVPMNAGDIRPGARNALAFLESSPGGAGPVQRSILAGTDALEGAVGRLGAGGTAQSPEAAGMMVQDAGRRAINWSRDQKNRLYDQAERLAGPMSVRADTAVTRLNDHITELMQTPNANRGILDLLHGMRDDLTTEAGDAAPVTIGALRNLRTAMRGEIGTRNLTMTDAERRVSDIIDAASGDITTALTAANPRAAQAYRRADAFYAQRQTYIRDIIQHITGPRDTPLSGEKAYERVMALAGPKGDRRRLVETMRSLSADEQRDVAATVATQLGRRSPDDDFSPARFVTMAEKLAPGARIAIFGQEGAEAVRDLVQLAAAKRDTGNSLNRSRSGQVANYAKVFTDILLGAGGGAALGGGPGAMMGAAGMAGASAAARNVSARLLTNPAFVAWLGRTPRTATPAQITTHIQRLGSIAIRQPAIRGEIGQVQRLLTDNASLAGRGVAANEGEDRRQQR